MPEADYHRHDISDKIWELLKPHLPGQRGQWGGIAQDNRRFINAVFFMLRTDPTMENGRPYIRDFYVGRGRELGKKFSTF